MELHRLLQLLMTMTNLEQIDTEIQKRSFQPRARSEETGLREEEPIRGVKESVGYWHVRLLTSQVLGMHYRTPQFNLALLEDHVNSRTFEKNRIRSSSYAAVQHEIRFVTGNGLVSYDVSKEIDPKRFLERFGLS
jgi:hypothetical protein